MHAVTPLPTHLKKCYLIIQQKHPNVYIICIFVMHGNQWHFWVAASPFFLYFLSMVENTLMMCGVVVKNDNSIIKTLSMNEDYHWSCSMNYLIKIIISININFCFLFQTKNRLFYKSKIYMKSFGDVITAMHFKLMQ